MTNDQKRALVLQWAESQLGVMEYPAGSNKVKYCEWMGHGPEPWCMDSVQWIFDRAGLPLQCKTSSCTTLANWAKTHGQWVTSGFKPGDIIFMHWKQSTFVEHVGICKANQGKYLEVYEGNTSLANQTNGGAYMVRNRALSVVRGAYRPWYNV